MRIMYRFLIRSHVELVCHFFRFWYIEAYKLFVILLMWTKLLYGEKKRHKEFFANDCTRMRRNACPQWGLPIRSSSLDTISPLPSLPARSGSCPAPWCSVWTVLGVSRYLCVSRPRTAWPARPGWVTWTNTWSWRSTRSRCSPSAVRWWCTHCSRLDSSHITKFITTVGACTRAN